MKFKVKVEDLIESLDPAMEVSTKGVRKDYNLAFLITIVSEKNGLSIYADGGRMAIKTIVNNANNADLGYECETAGVFTLKSQDLKATLDSFNSSDTILIEDRNSDSTVPDATKSDDAPFETNEDNVLAKRDMGREIIFTSVDSPEEFQTIPCFVNHIGMNQYVYDFVEANRNKNIKIKRNIFVDAANKIMFARGFEESREKYLYWVARVSRDEIRFVAGSGQRFAVAEIEGKNISNASVKSDKKDDAKSSFPTTILIPNEQSQPIVNILSEVSDEWVTFYVDKDRLIIESGHVLMSITRYDSSTVWPDESAYLDRDSSCKVITKISDWNNAIKGVSATFNRDLRKINEFHYAQVNVDNKKNTIVCKSDGLMKSNRKINLIDVKSKGDASFVCLSKYLSEAINHGENDGFVQIETLVEDNMKPIIFRYYAGEKIGDVSNYKKTNEVLGVSEKYSVFFAPSNPSK